MLGIPDRIPELQRTQSEILFDPKKSRNIGMSVQTVAANFPHIPCIPVYGVWCGPRLTMDRGQKL
jgi:hypothetical protein